MKKLTLLLSIFCVMFLVPVFGQTIDLSKRYVIENIYGIAWQPGVDQYSYIDDDQNIMLVNAKSGKETTFLAKASQTAHEISSPYGYEWLDANTLYFPRDHKTVNVLKGKITTTEFDKVDWDDVIDQDIKNKVFVIKNDKGVFVESALNGFKPVLLCQTGTQFANIGKLVISRDGNMAATIISSMPAQVFPACTSQNLSMNAIPSSATARMISLRLFIFSSVMKCAKTIVKNGFTHMITDTVDALQSIIDS